MEERNTVVDPEDSALTEEYDVGCGGVKVGYLTDVSCRKVWMSKGDDLMGTAIACS